MLSHIRRPGAHWTGPSTEFAVRSEIAETIELDLFDRGRFQMQPIGDGWFSLSVDDIAPGVRYGYRVTGPWDPGKGLLCNPNKLLVDPYARHITGALKPGPEVLGYDPGAPSQLGFLDSAPKVPHSVVIDARFDWSGDRSPETRLPDSVIYEVHVKGFTARHPEIPPALRGTYAGLAHEATIEHLVRLGVTAVELLPVHHFVSELHLLGSGRANYWGYNTLGFFAPHRPYASGTDPVSEFKAMVRSLHQAGIQVILDVVYNHTAEGDERGPTLSFRGFDNPGWYRLAPGDPTRNLNWSGTGNTLDFSSSMVVDLVVDSLKYWVEDMHVDGFRFDLATTLGRSDPEFDRHGAFFSAISREPSLQRVHLIAEPWDLGSEGYRLGRFPPVWAEWNDRFRDTVRDFWRSENGSLPEFASRITGSSDIFEWSGRGPDASINYVTSHDGFTLADLVTYQRRHNHANGEGNRDGQSDNRAWNSGTEGPTHDEEINSIRRRRSSAMLATLMISHGVPMILGGDEIGRTQGGNNNAYCQDNRVSWFDWDEIDQGMFELVARLIAFRKSHAALRRSSWIHDSTTPGSAKWLRPDGLEMGTVDWRRRSRRSFMLLLEGAVPDPEAPPRPALLLAFNPLRTDLAFRLPDAPLGWTVAIDSSGESIHDPDTATIGLPGYSMAVLEAVVEPDSDPKGSSLNDGMPIGGE